MAGAGLMSVGTLFAGTASAQQTLANTKSKGFLQCGTNPGLAGFAIPDAQGAWTGLDVDYCRAVAAAIFNDASKVRFIPLNARRTGFTALQSGEVDVLVAQLAPGRSSTRLAPSVSLFPVRSTYYDGQGFMVRKKPRTSPPPRNSTAPRSACSRAPRPN